MCSAKNKKNKFACMECDINLNKSRCIRREKFPRLMIQEFTMLSVLCCIIYSPARDEPIAKSVLINLWRLYTKSSKQSRRLPWRKNKKVAEGTREKENEEICSRELTKFLCKHSTWSTSPSSVLSHD